MNTRRTRTFLVLTFWLVLGTKISHAQPQTLVFSGNVAPNGGFFSSFSTPMINNVGQIAFQANLTGTNPARGVYVGNPGSLQALARDFDATPAGGSYFAPTSPSISDSGVTVFTSNIFGGAPTPLGLFYGVPGSVQSLALLGFPAPGGAGNYAMMSSPRINNAGQVIFSTQLSSGTSTVGVFLGTPGSLQAVALQGMPAPSGGIYGSNIYNEKINNAGQAAFFASLAGSPSDAGLFMGSPGSVQAVALSNTMAPSGGIYGNQFFGPSINNAGQISFGANLTGGIATRGLFLGSAGSVQTVALQGSPLPAGGNYQFSNSGQLNDFGQIVFKATLSGGSSTGGIFFGVPGALQTVALEGTSAPGGGTFQLLRSERLNNGGFTAFNALLEGPGVDSSNDEGLYAGFPGQVVKIVRKGDSIDVDSGPGTDFRIVAGIGPDFLDTVPMVSTNGTITVLYQLSFKDGSSGIFTSVVPEPGSLLALVCMVGLAGRKLRSGRNAVI